MFFFPFPGKVGSPATVVVAARVASVDEEVPAKPRLVEVEMTGVTPVLLERVLVAIDIDPGGSTLHSRCSGGFVAEVVCSTIVVEEPVSTIGTWARPGVRSWTSPKIGTEASVGA